VRQPNNKKQNLIKEGGLTYDDYASIDDGNRYELARGQLELMSPAPSLKKCANLILSLSTEIG